MCAWGTVGRFLRFAASEQPVPADPGMLRAAHLDRFHAHRAATLTPPAALRDLRQLLALLRQEPLRGLLAAEVADYLGRRWKDPRQGGRPGYSDGELARILAAARSDVVAVCARIEAGERLLHRYEHDRAALSGAERAQGAELAAMATTGIVPVAGGKGRRARKQLAGQLFLTRDDLPPLLVLMVALSGRNGETVKELPAAHRLLDDKAVEVSVIKRRRGPAHWIRAGRLGDRPAQPPPAHPGRVVSPGAQADRTRQADQRLASLWSVWRNDQDNTPGTAEHHDPFTGRLGNLVPLREWGQRHGLRDDDGNPMGLQLGRLRTSAEVRRTRQLGGHLPSAARSNTMQVLWGSYLRSDPAVIAWAEETMDAALGDAEQAALQAHAQALASHGGALRIIPGPAPAQNAAQAGLDAMTARRAAAGELDTAWTACTGRDASPWNEGTCRASFLDCFHCGNALITRTHLPRLLSLAEALEQRREQMNTDAWWRRYGPAWAAIRHHVLPEFSAAEVQAAAAARPADSLLDLAEGPREEP